MSALRYIEPEIGVFFSSGGFSEYFTAPEYQKHATKNYLSRLPKGIHNGLYAPGGRGM
jgi:tripeptidyl-peptidase-1